MICLTMDVKNKKKHIDPVIEIRSSKNGDKK